MGPSSEFHDATRITRSSGESTKVLSVSDIEQYQRDGFIVLENLVDPVWVERLQSAMNEFVEKSRSLSESNVLFDLEERHSAERPRLRRLVSPADLHETFWEFASQSIVVDVVEDLIGPDIKFHHSKLNFKEPGGGEEIQFISLCASHRVNSSIEAWN